MIGVQPRYMDENQERLLAPIDELREIPLSKIIPIKIKLKYKISDLQPLVILP